MFLFIYFWLHGVFVAQHRIFFPVVMSESSSPVAVHKLLTAVASLVSEHRL